MKGGFWSTRRTDTAGWSEEHQTPRKERERKREREGGRYDNKNKKKWK